MNKAKEYSEKFILTVDHRGDVEEAYNDGYHQAEKDLLENKHEKSWRLDEKLWKSIKDIEEASYQYMYDVSNDWAYDFPIWENVQDAFKAGSEWNEGFKLTWEDLKLLQDISHEVFAEVANGSVDYYQIYFTEQSFLEEVLKRFKERKETTIGMC